MKRFFKSIGVALSCAVSCAVLSSVMALPAMAAKPVELSFTASFYETHPVSINVISPWMDMVKELTKGQVEVVFYGPGTICPVTDILPSVESGIVDIGLNGLTMTPGRYPLLGMLELPMVFNSATHMAVTAYELIQKYPELRKEIEAFKILSTSASVPMQLITTSPIRTLEEMKGKKIAVTGQAFVQPISALGASPVFMQPTDIYMSLQRGMIDGLIFPIPSTMSFRLQEVAKYVTMIDLSVSSSFTLMNKDAWASLPQDAREAIEPTTELRGTVSYSSCSDLFVPRDIASMEKVGVTFIKLPPEEKDRWEQRVQSVHQAWLEAQNKKNPKVQAMYDDMIAIAAKYESLAVQDALRQELKVFNKIPE